MFESLGFTWFRWLRVEVHSLRKTGAFPKDPRTTFIEKRATIGQNIMGPHIVLFARNTCLHREFVGFHGVLGRPHKGS